MTIVNSLIRFRKIEELNKEGLNSTVFKAIDLQLDTELVIKQIPKSDFLSRDDFFAESRMLYSTTHPHIAPIQYACEDRDHIYLSMPLMKKGSLNSLMNSVDLTVRQIIEYALGFLSGLHFIHTKKLIHFDVKPTNILIDDSGRALITDFGLAKYVDEYGLARPDKMYNYHTPPEAFVGAMSNKADIYQAGLTLYRMCNGNECLREQPLTRQDIMDGKYPDRKHFRPHIPNRLRRTIVKAMNLDPDKRHNSVLEMINELSTIDRNLDWRYNEVIESGKVTTTWSLDKPNHVLRIAMIKNGEAVHARGTRERKSDGKVAKMNKWSGDFGTEKEALKFITDLFRSEQS